MNTPPLSQFDEQTVRDHRAWSDGTFGGKDVKGPIGPLKHLAKEAIEAAEAPDDIMEYADCAFLLLDALARSGFNFDDLNAAMGIKLKVILRRDYTTNQTADTDAPVQHA